MFRRFARPPIPPPPQLLHFRVSYRAGGGRPVHGGLEADSAQPGPTQNSISLQAAAAAIHGFQAHNQLGFQVDMAIVPAAAGEMGIFPGHVSSISELKPGLLSIHEGDEVTEYFVSSGFAFVHSNSVADIIAVEAVPIEHVDPDSVQKALTEFTHKMNTSSLTGMEKVEAQVAVDVLSALNASLLGSIVR
ncbi:ATP synthase subunit delta' mitochondrial [Phtheirospermum japonicum]|uniref:ATP synthase subunit delta' mitochondrial n=1 Tax=Phtheirospermum japonicum TaxID=374723 RepID=A0A830C559_9LAMI|nr:ATP synthase subunit delta' mitochondrial [Phtheirospermum japonicum]